MNSWIKADHDFGIPWVRLVVSLRSEVGQETLETIGNIALPQDIATYLEQKIAKVRPDLQGCIVCSVNCNQLPMRLSIDVSHPDLARLQWGESPPEQWLEPCQICRKPMMVASTMWRNANLFAIGKNDVCCSEECSKVEVLTVDERHEWVDCDTSQCDHQHQCKKCGLFADFKSPTKCHADSLPPIKQGMFAGMAKVIGMDLASGPGKQVVTFCSWCDDPDHPDPRCHPNGQAEHLVVDKWDEYLDCDQPSCVLSRNHPGDCKAADQVNKMTNGEYGKALLANTKVAQAMIDRGQAFRCSKCGKLRLMLDCATKDSPELKCKTCVGD